MFVKIFLLKMFVKNASRDWEGSEYSAIGWKYTNKQTNKTAYHQNVKVVSGCDRYLHLAAFTRRLSIKELV